MLEPLTSLFSWPSAQSPASTGMQNTMMKTKQLMDYLATHLDAAVRFYASDMILNVHSDASYLSKANAHSRACGHFFMGWKADPAKPIKLNGAFSTLCNFVPCHRFRRQSRTWGPLPQLQTSDNILTHYRRDGTPTTPPCSYTAITPQQWASQTTPRNGNDLAHGNKIILRGRCGQTR